MRMGSAFTAVALTSLIILTVAVITVGATPPDLTYYYVLLLEPARVDFRPD